MSRLAGPLALLGSPTVWLGIALVAGSIYLIDVGGRLEELRVARKVLEKDRELAALSEQLEQLVADNAELRQAATVEALRGAIPPSSGCAIPADVLSALNKIQ